MGYGSILAGPFLCTLALSILISQALAEDDSQCLQEFKASVKDPSNHLSNWIFGNSSAGSICNFIGVSCWNIRENKALAIKLQNAGLEGSFPSGLTQCRALENLDLSQNGFTGSIPSDLCKQVPYVVSLDLSQNSFSGNIPFTLEDCQYLQSLLLQHNKLSGELPGGIGLLPKLTSFDVSWNSLIGPIPSSFANGLASTERSITLGWIVGIIVAMAAVAACVCATGVWCFFFRDRKMEIASRKSI